MPDDAAIGWQHPCETLKDNGAHINEICAAAQLWSPATWSAKPVPANPSWEGNTWQGHNGAQSRPGNILLSVDLTAPQVTIDFRFSHTMRGTALASIDHAPLRLTMQYRFRVRKQREKPRRLDRAKLAAATTDLHIREAFQGGGREVGAGEFGQLEAIGSGGTPRPKLAIHGKFHSQSGVDGIPRRRLAKEAMVEQRHDGSDHREGGSGQVGSLGCGQPRWVRSASTSTRKARNWGKQWQYTDKTYFCMFYGLGFAAFSWKAYKPNQAQLRSRQTGAHRWAGGEHESRDRVPRLQDSVATGS